MGIFELQPLRIQAGWRIEINNFTEYDIEKDGEKYSFELCEDLLQLSFNEEVNIIIDLGWYPSGDINGNYILQFIKDYNWDFPLEELITRSKKEVISCLEKWTCHGFYHKYL